ncbi:MFS transporter [Phenylobacterium soli]|uniref:MFS transporter n=1 Tax=Phenylobacterium soli TaxID=2170551 RepID=A0A328AIT3_9CAUL|nr:MFS transporter [Phenylobacterium soli]RAK54690.1 MFS transporter [Phenylobacterium soli]
MTAAAAAPKTSIARVAMTSLAASSIEWYDFFIYGTAAALVFPKLFFAASLPPFVAQLAAFSTFAVGFIARPVGGVLFGHFGDLVGRKKALVTALMLMGLATTAVGLLPSYATAGWISPMLLILLRFAQGLAVGGQWGGAVLIATENAPPGKRGFYGSFAQMGVPAGVATANLIFLLMTANLAPEAFQAWGWRIPFLLSVLLVGLGLYVHLMLEDTAEFRALEQAEDKAERRRSPILQALVKHPKEILLGAGAFVAANGTFYVMITYAVAYATTTLHVPRTSVLWAVMLGSLISAPFLPLMAALSDRMGRRGVFMAGALLCGAWSVPFFLLLNSGAFPLILVAMAVGLTLNNFMYGPQAALMTELFSTELRYSGASLGYQLGAIFGGAFAPIISTALYEHYRSAMAISAYWAVLCGVAFLSVFLLSETNRRAGAGAKAAAKTAQA